ncbi:MAG: MotA/TolQ/ExbB proton channel family protein [Butyrivibrio sp.]|nr:MotA/TolQ/ExbB proton channel family protein [Butyrivibrio sp.]
MEMYSDAFKLLLKSIMGNDFLILLFAILTVFLLFVTLILKHSIKKRVEGWKAKRNENFTKYLYVGIRVCYTVFTTLITVFPLLGMFGTVCGLLGLDLANGDMTNIKNNFFIALTSTAWGIIFSVIFKIANSIIADGVEEQIEKAKELSEERL